MAGSIQLTSLDHYFADFINRIDKAPSEWLWLAAALVSAESSQGHTCLDLSIQGEKELLPYDRTSVLPRLAAVEGWKDKLVNCSTVGRPGDFTPLILDDAGRLYLHRSWNYEKIVAEGLLARGAAGRAEIAGLRDKLDRFFPLQPGQEDRQRIAAETAMSGRLTVISGGPGTGKTTTVARILALLVELSGEPGCHIALAAPTGKAASRLRQSILKSLQSLPLEDNVLRQMPQEVKTIHRLLGVRRDGVSFRHNRENPLPCNVLVVDEVSMVDLPLMAKLLDALSPECRLILLGDKDQLASVEGGAVLADICNRLPATEESRSMDKPLGAAVVNLTKSFRFGAGSGIGELSRMVNAGDSQAAFEVLSCGGFPDLVWKQLPPERSFEAEYSSAIKSGYREYMAAPTAELALEQLDRFRVLSPYREGTGGVDNLNRLALSALGLKKRDGHALCSRMPVMVSGNNYELGLFNGDTAVLQGGEGEKRLTACFAEPDGAVRHVSVLRLPAFETALALTVHKCQGSEFDHILLILPDMETEILTRELIYTAVTRARKSVEIWCSRDTFCRAVERKISRNSGLREKLWGSQL
jgi:exodeoxyribonuclease V alpha subunit